MKLGIVGNGNIVKVALQAIKETKIQVTGLWCRNETRGAVVTKEFGIPSLYTDYQRFLDEGDFDTVYIGLPNHLHYAYAKEALLAGKHVIVEKPFTTTLKETEELIDLAKEKHVYLFEAILSRYSHNYWELKKYLGKLGEIRLIESHYCQYSSRYDAYRKGEVLPAFDPQCSGGALYDINVYNIHFVTGLFGKPNCVRYMANLGFNGIDTSGIVTLQYDGFQAECTGAKDCAGSVGSRILGTDGWIEIPNRPGFVQGAVFHDRKTGVEQVIDVQEEKPMLQEFVEILRVLEEKDEERMLTWLEETRVTMEVLVKAREDAGIVMYGE